jgi:hypothetical protein
MQSPADIVPMPKCNTSEKVTKPGIDALTSRMGPWNSPPSSNDAGKRISPVALYISTQSALLSRCEINLSMSVRRTKQFWGFSPEILDKTTSTVCRINASTSTRLNVVNATPQLEQILTVTQHAVFDDEIQWLQNCVSLSTRLAHPPVTHQVRSKTL